MDLIVLQVGGSGIGEFGLPIWDWEIISFKALCYVY